MAVSNSSDPRINQILDADRSIHDWYRFVLSFPPHLIRQYLDDFGAAPGQVVLDPFCGTGTTPVEVRKQGFAGVGLEAHPMMCFASNVKTNWEIVYDDFERDSVEIARRATEQFAAEHLSVLDDLPLFAQTAGANGNLRRLDPHQEKLILTDSISPRPLHRILVLLDLIRAKAKPWTNHQELALASTLVADASNLKFGPEVGVNRQKKHDVDVILSWLKRVKQISADLQSLEGGTYLPASVFRGDARQQLPLEDQSIDFVITSPPYPNEKDYTRTTRLESVVLGFITSRDELRAVKQSLIRSNTRNVYVADQDDDWIQQFESIRGLAETIEARRLELGKTSGFERQYHRVVSLYFGGMARHFEALKRVLVPGARCAYVVGDQESFFRIPVRTGELLAEIAAYCGYEVERIDLWRTRLATATNRQVREEVVILRWPG